MSQDFWFPKAHAGIGYVMDMSNKDRCILIKLPLYCPICNKSIRISGPGNADDENGIIDSCDHTETYPRLWQLRIIEKATSVASSKNTNYGCICMRCNSRNPYAIPNRPGDKYLCFECRH